MTSSEEHQQWLGVTIWNNVFLDVMYSNILLEELEKLP
jgi:hypothetical protein